MPGLETDRKLVEALRQQEQLTESQVRRVLSAIESGKELMWALSHLPLIEPLQFLKAQSALATGVGLPFTGPTPTPSANLPTPARGNRVTDPITRSGDRLSEQTTHSFIPVPPKPIPTIELHPGEDYGLGFEGIAQPVKPPSALPVRGMPTPTPKEPASNPGLKMLDLSAYMRPGVSPPMYDLADDEDIPLVQRVNAILTEAHDSSVRQLDIVPMTDSYSLCFWGLPSAQPKMKKLEIDEGLRIINRVKVMARIEPWKKPPQKGCFSVVHRKRSMRILMDICAPEDDLDKQTAYLHFIPIAT